MRTETNAYEFSHGKKPRGNGYWGFEITGTTNTNDQFKETIFKYGNLADAKKEAIKEFKAISRKLRVLQLTVLP